jgi:hypothetical protein
MQLTSQPILGHTESGPTHIHNSSARSITAYWDPSTIVRILSSTRAIVRPPCMHIGARRTTHDLSPGAKFRCQMCKAWKKYIWPLGEYLYATPVKNSGAMSRVTGLLTRRCSGCLEGPEGMRDAAEPREHQVKSSAKLPDSYSWSDSCPNSQPPICLVKTEQS